MTCFANNEGVERVLRDILFEVQKISREASPPTPPAPYAAGLPERFLAISNGQIKQYIRLKPDIWEVLDVCRMQYMARKSDQEVKTIFGESEQVWVMYPK